MQTEYAIAKLLADKPVSDADIASLPEPGRSIARRVVSANGQGPMNEFYAAVEALLPTVAERDNFCKAVFAVDPEADSETATRPPLTDQAGQAYAAQAKDLADAFAPRPKLPSVVHGILPARSISTMYGGPGNLKSSFLMDLCVAVATGTTWLPDLPGKGNNPGVAVSQGPVLWTDVDNGEDIVAERMAAFARAYQAPADTPIRWLCFPTPPLMAARGLPGLTSFARNMGAVLIVIDNLLRIAGVRDENASEMDAAMLNLRRLAEDTGAAVAVIHHRRKDTLGREGDSLRGHSSIEGALDAAFLVKRDDGANEITIKCTKARRAPVESFAALWTYELQADGETLHSARFFRTEIRDHAAEAAQALEQQILTVLQANGCMNTRAVMTAVHGRSSDITAALAALHMAGKVACEPGRGTEKIYKVA